MKKKTTRLKNDPVIRPVRDNGDEVEDWEGNYGEGEL